MNNRVVFVMAVEVLQPARTSVTGLKLRTRRKLSSMPEGTQRYSRTKMVLPLRMWPDERAGDTLSPQWVHTIDISQIGCRLGGLRTKLSPGQTIALQRGRHKVPFRVIWSKHLAVNENQAGIEALDYGRSIWAVDLPSYPIEADSIEPCCDTEDSSATASARSTTPGFIPVAAHPRVRRGLSLGLLILNPALALSVYNGVFYEWGLSFALLLLSGALALSLYQGRATIQPPVPAAPIAEDLDCDEP